MFSLGGRHAALTPYPLFFLLAISYCLWIQRHKD